MVSTRSGLPMSQWGCLFFVLLLNVRINVRRRKNGTRLSKEAVDAPSLEAFNARLDVALGSLGCWLVTLHIAGG